MPPTAGLDATNRLLSRLPPGTLDLLHPKLVPLVQGQIIHAADAYIEAAHFPLSGMLSLIVRLEDGTQAEVGMIGVEGMAGEALASGVEVAFVECVVQLPGAALRIEVAAFRDAVAAYPQLRAAVARHAEALHAQAAQSALCNARHLLRHRLARWLLMAHDRAGSDEMPLTQEFLGLMLAAYRPNVTTAARSLQSAGAIDYRPGRVVVLDRHALEGCACECYASVRRRCDLLSDP